MSIGLNTDRNAGSHAWPPNGMRRAMQPTVRNERSELFALPHCAALSFLVLTLVTAGGYGFFGDELYYFACSKRLAWGYVDQPPMVAFLTFLSARIFGETIFSLRLMSGLAGAVTVLLAARIARLLGGGKFSQSLAALSICFATAIPALSSFFSMNPVDIMLCTLFVALFLSAVKSPSRIKWIAFGIVIGAGLLNKYTFLVLGFSLFVSLILTRQWKILKQPWMYFSAALGFLIFLPHIVWQVDNGWPTLEFMQNATQNKNLTLSSLVFLAQLAISLNPFTLPVWLCGLAYLLSGKDTKEFRFLGWTVMIFLFIYMVQNSKVYYVVPIFPVLLGAGSVAVERFSLERGTPWLRWVTVSFLVASGAILMPLAVPILPVEQFVTYAKTLHIWNALRMEKGEGDVLPLHFVHRLGWKELVDTVSVAYNALPQGERDRCAVLGSWYGTAGAIDHFGPNVGLPNSICPRNNYWLWGTREYSMEVVLAVGYNVDYLQQFFHNVKRIASFDQPYAYGAEIILCKSPKYPIDELWRRLKRFI